MVRLNTGVILWRLWREARPCWRCLLGILLLSLLSPPLTLLLPVPLKIVVDNVIGHHPLPRVLAGLLPESVKHSDSGLLLFAVALVVAVALLSVVLAGFVFPRR